MLVPLSWLKRYVPVDLPAGELAHRLTMAGTEIGAVEETGADWDRDKVLVGHVLEVNPHPNADRLTLPTVDLGSGETATVVCGAPNVAAGQKIAFAREGAMLLSNRTGKVEPLKAAKIRGVLSSGMVCSERELGLGDDHDGILVLDDDLPVGTPLVDVLGDAVLDAEVTPNRPDCLSILGVAREVGAITGVRVTEPDAAYPEDGPPIADRVTVEIEDPALCPRYTAGLVEGVSVGPSPQWLRSALEKAGQRPINNIVDITNFVMLEYGQPMHAFDYDKVADGAIIVRQARRGERLATLDDETHDLRPPMLAIADPSGPVALAGVVGGVDSSVTEGTTSVLLESANFDPSNTHRTKRALGNGTEASYRFERGIRADLAHRALRRAIRLILDVAGRDGRVRHSRRVPGPLRGPRAAPYPGAPAEGAWRRSPGRQGAGRAGVAGLPGPRRRGRRACGDGALLALGHRDRGRRDRGDRPDRGVRRHTHDGDGDSHTPSQPQALRGAEGVRPRRPGRSGGCRRS